ncbi:MAG: polysaccharide deacetylase family protein [Proteobacteria bacterium]|nr:polysaccharide deacetylase family protein [Pseudomonadota bacterium]
MKLISTIAKVGILIFFVQSAFAAATGEPIRHVKTDEKVVALTFDDGPDKPYTEQILGVLDKHNVKATFFVLGGNAKAYPDLIKKIMKDGHDLGNHTMSHSMMKNKSVETMKNDIASVDKILRNLGYEKEITFRAPFGITSPNLKTALQQLDKRMVLFTFLPQDWTKISSQQIYNNVMKQMKPGLIITLHDGGARRENTVKATEMLIDNLQKQGYRFVTVSELLKLQK